jgi:hypothetical protein
LFLLPADSRNDRSAAFGASLGMVADLIAAFVTFAQCHNDFLIVRSYARGGIVSRVLYEYTAAGGASERKRAKLFYANSTNCRELFSRKKVKMGSTGAPPVVSGAPPDTLPTTNFSNHGSRNAGRIGYLLARSGVGYRSLAIARSAGRDAPPCRAVTV